MASQYYNVALILNCFIFKGKEKTDIWIEKNSYGDLTRQDFDYKGKKRAQMSFCKEEGI